MDPITILTFMATLSSSADVYSYAIEPWICGLYYIVKYRYDEDIDMWHWVDKDLLSRIFIPIPCIDYEQIEA